MSLLNTLKQQAREVYNLSDDYVRQFGKLTLKSTWQSALEAAVQAQAQAELNAHVEEQAEDIAPGTFQSYCQKRDELYPGYDPEVADVERMYDKLWITFENCKLTKEEAEAKYGITEDKDLSNRLDAQDNNSDLAPYQQEYTKERQQQHKQAMDLFYSSGDESLLNVFYGNNSDPALTQENYSVWDTQVNKSERVRKPAPRRVNRRAARFFSYLAAA